MYRRRLAADPRDAQAAHALATIAAAEHDYREAEALWRQALRARPDWVEPRRALAQLYLDWGRVDDAVELLRAGLARRPDSVDLLYALGLALEDAGDRDGAEHSYRAAIARDPAWGAPQGALLTMLRDAATPEDLARADALLSDPALPHADRALLAYGIGRVHEARGEHAQAFRALELANAARCRVAGPFDRESFASRIDETIAAFSAEILEGFRSWQPSLPWRPIFIVGMPRSGTTLAERILSAHPQVTGYGETPELPRLARRMAEYCASLLDWPQAVADLTPESAAEAARAYIEAVAGNDGPPTPWFTDKLPFNFHHVGLISALFPNAAVVVCRRDPRDVAVSIWSENFAASHRYATSLADTAFCIAQFERLMRHWEQHAPVHLVPMSYERLVADPDTGVRRLVEAVGLEWDPRCARFFETGDAVQTPSRWQVRRPVYTSSVGRWRRFEPWLGPLLDEIRRLGITLPDPVSD